MAESALEWLTHRLEGSLVRVVEQEPKQPLIASLLLCLTGNVVYCPWDAHAGIALPMLLAGRLWQGWGAAEVSANPVRPYSSPILLTSGTLSSESISGEQALHRGLCVLEEADCRLRSLCRGQRGGAAMGRFSPSPSKISRFQDCGILHQLDHGRSYRWQALARLHHLPADCLRTLPGMMTKTSRRR